MARRRQLTRAARRGPKNQVWTVSLRDDFEITTGVTVIAFSIILDSDWERTSASSERATILRTRGWISIRPASAAGVQLDGTVFMYLTVQDDDATSVSAGLAATYADEDILWTGGVLFPPGSIVVQGGFVGSSKDILLDVKAMRKLRSGQTLELVVTNNMAGSIFLSGVIRSLLRMGGN